MAFQPGKPGVNPFAKKLSAGIVNPAVVTGTPVSKGNGGSMQSQLDAVKRRLAADVADDKKADKAEPAGPGKKKAIKGIAGSAEGGNPTPNQTSNGIG
ncbi:MAG TPA: hypothetical protein VIY48_21280 [Candidatus Paceibacterota bacterium]